eukprot:NODE_4843_length_753_cov_113.149148_g3732_i1.p1 GENE.NODE_4843_length_753_cov_113.149148_g3732_i1~~NODE_4843_length_753_cov_113.149148_g3732_i1.p1  ORF type:complete len:204 (+),score=41.61 NODE_4843_length_753_cov_113.149148_g3732_i1:139-750(+)
MNGHRAVLSGLHLSRRQLFDTHYVIKELSEKGFTHDQAVAICDVFHSIQREGDAIFCDNVTSLDLLRELERSARANIDQLRNEMRQLREEMAVSVEQQKLFAKQTEVANRFDSRCEKILADNQIASVDAALRNVERKCTGRLSAVSSATLFPSPPPPAPTPRIAQCLLSLGVQLWLHVAAWCLMMAVVAVNMELQGPVPSPSP